MAWFTDEDDAGEATFTAGTLSIDVSDGLKEFYDEEIKLLTTIDHMNPGDDFGPIEIIIENTGNKKLMWLGDLQFTLDDFEKNSNLLDAMYISYAKMEHLKSDGTTTWTDDAEFIINDGTEAFSLNSFLDAPSFLTNSDGSAITPVMTLNGFDGHNQNTGTGHEFAGALIPGNKYKLTLHFAFHKRAGNECQGDVASPVTIGFKVNAYQLNEEYYNELENELGGSLGAYTYYTGLINMQQ
jgi:hypothetical protein